MSTLQININNGVAIIMLDRGRSNPINHQMVVDLTNAIKELEADKEVGGVIITGKPGFFSSGIDLMEAYDYNEAQVKQFWTDFLALPQALAAFKKPLVAAVSGHSPAGGCVIALCCDYRIMAEGQFIIGLNEIPVGIIVPDSIFNLYSFWLGQNKAYQYIMEGKLLTVAEALETGLVDAVVPEEELMASAEKKIRTYMQMNRTAWSTSKMNLRKELINKLNSDQTENLNIMLKQWWAPAIRKGLETMIENLKSKSARS
jgi:enoyl-CoA hydratase/carnithine racemase